MFTKSRRFYEASCKHHPAEAGRVRAMIEARLPGARTLLDVACGTVRRAGDD